MKYTIFCHLPQQSCLIERNIDTNKGFDVFKADNKLGLVLNDNYYYISKDKNDKYKFF
ncbi:MAG: hypothetical protein ACLT2Z_04245 [Eubacterium sp.]